MDTLGGDVVYVNHESVCCSPPFFDSSTHGTGSASVCLTGVRKTKANRNRDQIPIVIWSRVGCARGRSDERKAGV